MKVGVLITGISQILIFLFGFLNGWLIIKVMGSEGKGQIAYLLSFSQIILPFISLGIRQSVSYFSKSSDEFNESKKSKYISFSLTLSLIFSILFYCLLYLFHLINFKILLLLNVITVFNVFISIKTIFALSNQKFITLNFAKIAPLLFQSIILLVIYSFYSILTPSIYLLLISFSLLISILLIKSERYNFNFRISNYKIIKPYLLKGISYSIPLTLIFLNYKLDIILLKFFNINDSKIGVYSLAVNYTEILFQIPAILSLVIFSHGLVAEKSTYSKKIKIIHNRIILLLIPTVFLFERLCNHFIPKIYGDEFIESSRLLSILVLSSFFIISFNILNTHLASSYGKPMHGLKPLLFSLIINVLLNCILIPSIGIKGAAISTTISYSVLGIIYFFQYKKFINENL
jgi:O-antigen/teichoic acid export membrane protein